MPRHGMIVLPRHTASMMNKYHMPTIASGSPRHHDISMKHRYFHADHIFYAIIAVTLVAVNSVVILPFSALASASNAYYLIFIIVPAPVARP